MKALDGYILMVLFVLLRTRVHFFLHFSPKNGRRRHGSESVTQTFPELTTNLDIHLLFKTAVRAFHIYTIPSRGLKSDSGKLKDLPNSVIS